MADLYDLLGVQRDATPEQIKKAYRLRARELHPDAPNGDEEKFKALNAAHEVLSDPQKRAHYDRFGDAPRGQGGDPFGFGAAGFGGLGDVLDAFFGTAFSGQGGGRQQGRARQGRDVLVPTRITLEEVATGVRRGVEVDVATTCSTCAGSGSPSGTAPAPCTQCRGTGQVQRVVRTAFGQLATAAACPRCEGVGKTVADPCTDCGGQGRRQEHRTITVEITPGIEHGDRLRVSGAGEAGRNGAPAGDLYVEVQIEEHEVFERHGRDLIGDVRVPVSQAILGASLDIRTINDETVEVRVPAGTQHGDVVSVRKAGLPARGGGPRGDLHLRMDVVVPTDLSDEQAELVREFASLRGEDVQEDDGGLFGRFKRGRR